MIRMPRIITDGAAGESLHALSASINLNIKPLSTASVTLPAGSQVKDRSFIELFTETGSVGVFRARTPKIGIGSQNSIVELEHAITDLGDWLVSADIEKEYTLPNAIKEVMKYYKGGRWKLGKVSKSTKVVLKASYDSCLDAILDVMEQEPSVMMTFSFGSYPWTFAIADRPTEVTAEGRLSRNVRSATITRDDTELCTRVYLDGLPRTKAEEKAGTYGHLDASTLKTYGVIEQEITGANATEEQAKRTANLYLEKHKNPRYSITIDATDLSSITGETLDKFTLGKRMRLALPDYGITVEEVITQISWTSVYDSPRTASITLSDEEDTVVQVIKSASKAGKSAGKKVIKKEKEYKTIFDQTDNLISLWAGKTDKAGKILQQAGMELDRDGILTYAKDAEKGVYSQIKQQADAVSSEVTTVKEDLNGKIKQNTTKITQTSKKIGMVVEEKDGKNVIKAAEIAVAINDSTGETEAKINASHVYIGNDKSTTVINGKCKLSDVTADYINNKIATISTMTGIAATFSGNVTAAGLIGTGIYVKVNGNNVSISNPVLELRTDPSNDKTIQYKNATSTTWEVLGTFDSATTLSGAWSGNTYTVTASPQGVTLPVTPVVHVITSQGAAYTDIKVATGNSSTGYTDHGNATRLYLVKSGLTVYLKDQNSVSSGTNYAQTTCSDPHSSSMTIRQVSGYQSARKMKLYWTDNTVTTIPSGFHLAYSSDTYWYRSGTDLNQTGSNKTVYY